MASKQTKTSVKPTGGGSPEKTQKAQPSETQSQSKEMDLSDLKFFIRNEISEIKDVVRKEHDDIRNDIILAVAGLSKVVAKLDQKVTDFSEEIEEKIEGVEDRTQRLERDMVIMQFKSMEKAVRLRGMKENIKEDLEKVCADALSVLLQVDPQEIIDKMDRVYRVNSWFARKRNLPRDVVIYFTERKIRNDVVQASYSSGIQVGGHLVEVYKELPAKMIRDRREFGFLVSELRKREVQFRWETPFGMSLKYNQIFYRLTSIEKARDFYVNVLQAGRPPSPTERGQRGERQQREEQEQESNKSTYAEIVAGARREVLELSKEDAQDLLLAEPLQLIPFESTRDIALDLERKLQEPKEQRMMTRDYEKKLKKQQEEMAMAMERLNKSEAVGGAKPKVSVIQQDLDALFLKLQKKPDGK